MAGETVPMLQAIERPHLILVEGRDDEVLFRALLRHVERADVEVRSHQGKDGLRRFLDGLRFADGFGDLSTLTVVRDADSDCKAALQSVGDALSAYGFGCPAEPLALTGAAPQVAAIIMPCGEKTGSLENL